MKAEAAPLAPTVLAIWIKVGALELEGAAIRLDDQDRPTIVFLHEGLGCLNMWRDFPARLCQKSGCNGLVYSREGYGKSTRLRAPRRPDFMHHEADEILPAVLASHGLERPILFGHSDGASIALLYSAHFPDRPLASIVLAPHIRVEDQSIEAIEATRRAYLESDLKARLQRHHADVDGAFFGWNDIWLAPEFRSWTIEDDLPAIRAPLLAIQGWEDPYGSMAQIDGIADRVTGTELVKLAACGHSPHRDQAEATLAAADQFLKGCGVLG